VKAGAISRDLHGIFRKTQSDIKIREIVIDGTCRL